MTNVRVKSERLYIITGKIRQKIPNNNNKIRQKIEKKTLKYFFEVSSRPSSVNN
jgi:hypothetical protein